jgi:hypothetical protein
MYIKEKKNLIIIGVTIAVFFSGSLISTGITNINAATAQSSTTSSQSQTAVQSGTIQAGTPNELGQQLSNQLNKILQTPGVQPSSIWIKCYITNPPMVFHCQWGLGSASGIASSNSPS